MNTLMYVEAAAYMFRAMRRFRQQISEEECIRVLREQPRGVLSMIGDDGYPYGIPLDHWYSEEDNKLYLSLKRHKGKIAWDRHFSI